MLRLPCFEFHQPRSLGEALALRVQSEGEVAYVAGGTDLYPNMKRRQQTPRTVISLARIPELQGVTRRSAGELDIGAGVTLNELASHPLVLSLYPAVAHAAREVSTPLLRNMGTIGGNLLIDTRCNYYNQSQEWRRAINFCMKRDGEICWVAPSSPRCWAVQSSDGAPVAVALGAEVTLIGPEGQRRIPAAALYRNDGIQHLTKRPEELLAVYHLPPPDGWYAGYAKLRRRGSFDFPVVGAAAWIRPSQDGLVTEARIVLGAVASYPMQVDSAAEALIGRPLDSNSIAEAADAAYKPAKPMDNTDFTLSWRKEMVRVYVRKALEAIAAQRSSGGG